MDIYTLRTHMSARTHTGIKDLIIKFEGEIARKLM